MYAVPDTELPDLVAGIRIRGLFVQERLHGTSYVFTEFPPLIVHITRDGHSVSSS
jgi:hypothetical protein